MLGSQKKAFFSTWQNKELSEPLPPGAGRLDLTDRQRILKGGRTVWEGDEPLETRAVPAIA